jgi:hypothetical protein
VLVKCDYLDLTYPIDGNPLGSISDLLFEAGFVSTSSADDAAVLMRCPTGYGTFKAGVMYNSFRTSISGDSLDYLRSNGFFSEYLSLSSEHPHTVTRLDSCIDLPIDGADLVDHFISLYPNTVCLSQKPLRVTRLLSTRDDGRLSGSVYAGRHSSARVILCLYDKAYEVFCKRNTVIPPTGRIEIRGRRDIGLTLRDAFSPESFFFSFLPHGILKTPDHVLPWEPFTDMAHVRTPREFTPYQVLQRRVESSAELARLLDYAHEHNLLDSFSFFVNQRINALKSSERKVS